MWTNISATANNPHVSISADHIAHKSFVSSFAYSALYTLSYVSTLLSLLLGSL
ncbi:MAG TPA: hypothetical protein VHX42_05070 [Candidatus Babeliales bacterium]|nr:hypothetical protein [Candidatus Babeliales bacterium]